MNPPLPLHTDGPSRRTILAQPADTNPEERRMKDIDWSKAPEGATHFHPGNAKYSPHWLKKGYFCVTAFEHNGWVREVAGTPLYECVVRPTTPQWTGTGLPPVGARVVNADDVKGSSEVIMHRKGGVIIEQEAGVAADYLWMPRSACRPIRTPEQIAAEERANHIADMEAVFLSVPPGHGRMAALYDAGYRMTAEDER